MSHFGIQVFFVVVGRVEGGGVAGAGGGLHNPDSHHKPRAYSGNSLGWKSARDSGH